MNKSKAKAFLKELNELESKYGIAIAAAYEEELDYNFDDCLYTSGISTYLVLVDEKGNELDIDSLSYEIEDEDEDIY